MLNKYIEKLTDQQIIKFIATYVKNSHIKMHDCYEDCKMDVNLKREDGKVYVKTILSDCAGVLEENWILSDFRVISEEYDSSEIVGMTKIFAKYVYDCFYKQDKELASTYKREYVEQLEAIMESEIAGAKHKFQEKMF